MVLFEGLPCPFLEMSSIFFTRELVLVECERGELVTEARGLRRGEGEPFLSAARARTVEPLVGLRKREGERLRMFAVAASLLACMRSMRALNFSCVEVEVLPWVLDLSTVALFWALWDISPKILDLSTLGTLFASGGAAGEFSLLSSVGLETFFRLLFLLISFSVLASILSPPAARARLAE